MSSCSALDLADVEMLGPAVVYDATPNTATVDEDPVGVPLGPAVEDIVGEFNGADTVVDLRCNGPSIPSFTRDDNAVVGPYRATSNPRARGVEASTKTSRSGTSPHRYRRRGRIP